MKGMEEESIIPHPGKEEEGRKEGEGFSSAFSTHATGGRIHFSCFPVSYRIAKKSD